MNNIGEILRKKRNDSGLSVKEISNILIEKGFKASEKTIYSWESGNSQPSPDSLLIMCKAYGVKDVLSTFGYDQYGDSDDISIDDLNMIRRYHDLDPHGKAMIDTILDLESKRMTAAPDKIREITYYRRQASAGTGQVLFDDTFAELIPIPDVPEYKRVSYAIGVNGNSMEPVYQDEDILLVETTNEIEHGDIGIFIVGNESFVKELGNEELISLNKDYDNIPLTEDSKCMGRVVGKM